MHSPLSRARLALRRDLTLGSLAHEFATTYGTDPWFVASDGETMSFVAAAQLVDCWAGDVADRIAPGAVVALTVPNGPQLFLAVLAVARAGGVALPLNDRMRPEEVDHIIEVCGAALVLDQLDADHEPLGESRAGSPGDVAALFTTSGTTGSPKGAELTHAGLLSRFPLAALVPDLGHGEAVTALPVAHIMGFVAVLGLACQGRPTVVLPRFDAAAVLEVIERRRASAFVGVPTMYRMMDAAGAAERDLRSVHLWMSGADVMPNELARRFQRFGSTVVLPLIGPVGEAAFVEGYGMVELSGGVAVKVSPPFVGRFLPADALGLPVPPNRLRVVDESGRTVPHGGVGELQVKGPGVLSGYRNRPEASAEALTDDGWLRTGDLARRGLLGTVSFAGRSKDVIKNGGYSVLAVDVQATLETHPDVIEAAVVGRPDPINGEVPVAALVLRPGSKTTADELLAWARVHVSDYKRPRAVIIVTDLPRTATAKVRKAEVLELFAALE